MNSTNPIGITKREHFAALILGGMYANPDFPSLQFDEASKMAIEQADSLLEMLEISRKESTQKTPDEFYATI